MESNTLRFGALSLSGSQVRTILLSETLTAAAESFDFQQQEEQQDAPPQVPARRILTVSSRAKNPFCHMTNGLETRLENPFEKEERETEERTEGKSLVCKSAKSDEERQRCLAAESQRGLPRPGDESGNYDGVMMVHVRRRHEARWRTIHTPLRLLRETDIVLSVGPKQEKRAKMAK
jgi:hypothetical protein